MLWFFVCNIMLTDVGENTSSSSLALNGLHLLFVAELQANHNADLYTALAFCHVGVHTQVGVRLPFCYTDFMATKTVAAATTISFADLKGLVFDRRNQRQLQWAHRDHRTLLMVDWVLPSSLQGNLAISIKWFQVPAGIISSSSSASTQVCVLLVFISKTRIALEQQNFLAMFVTEISTRSSRFIVGVSGSLQQLRTCFEVPRFCVFSQTIKKTLLQLCIIAMDIYYVYS